MVEKAVTSSSKPPPKKDLSFNLSHRIGIKQRDDILGTQWVWNRYYFGQSGTSVVPASSEAEAGGSFEPSNSESA